MINGNKITAIIDTAAAVSVIREDVARSIIFGPLNRPLVVQSADGSPIQVSGSLCVTLEVAEQSLPVNLLVLPYLQYDMLLGLDILRQLPFSISCSKGKLEGSPDTTSSLPLTKSTTELSLDTTTTLPLTKSTSELGPAPKCQDSNIIPKNLDVNVELQDDQKQTIRDILQSYGLKLATYSSPGRSCATQHSIVTETDKPVYQHPYRASFAKQEFMREELRELLEEGKIRKSHSPYGSPVVLPLKKDGSYRFAIDYRRLNKITRKDGFPLPRIDDILDRLTDAKYFATLNAKSGYHQIPMAEKDIPKTAFVVPDGHYEWLVMPFGLCNAPATFQRFMNELLAGLLPEKSVVYIDDILVFGATWDEFISNLKEVLHRIATHGVVLNFKKCSFGYTKVQFLGHVIQYDGIRLNEAKAEILQSYPLPKCKEDLKRFLGLSGYFSKFVVAYASRVRPLQDLLKHSSTWRWTECEQAAFDDINKHFPLPLPLLNFAKFLMYILRYIRMLLD